MVWIKIKRIVRSGFFSFWRNGFVSLSACLLLLKPLTFCLPGAVAARYCGFRQLRPVPGEAVREAGPQGASATRNRPAARCPLALSLCLPFTLSPSLSPRSPLACCCCCCCCALQVLATSRADYSAPAAALGVDFYGDAEDFVEQARARGREGEREAQATLWRERQRGERSRASALC